MPQLQLPFFPHGVTEITTNLAFGREYDRITYYHGTLPTFSHDKNDLATFRMITSQFVFLGHVSQAQIARAFGIALVTVKRSAKLYREFGPQGFYKDRKTRGAAVLIDAVLLQVQQRLDNGITIKDIAAELNLKQNTLDKAVRDGRLHVFKKETETQISCKSERTELDAVTPMGVATHNVIGRLAASIGGYGTTAPHFEAALDVPHGGVLCALPALLAMGLLEGTDTFFTLPPGYYAADSLLILLSFMTLNRMQTIEKLRDDAPGEWGKLLGLDRAPEVRTLRKKVQIMSQTGKPEEWSASLSQRWMGQADAMDPSASSANVLCIDGHVRVYHGEQTQLPKHYVAREKLCLRATVDYWVNSLDGQPFMVINQVVDHGLIHTIEKEILPRLEVQHPAFANATPSVEQTTTASETNESEKNDMAPAVIEGEFIPASKVKSAPKAPHRLTLVFDREGYSPEFFLRMRDKGVACLTYHKYPGPAWPEEEFQTSSVRLVSGHVVSMRLAERGTCMSNKLWLREIRKLTERGHQTSILATDYLTPMDVLASRMFARWSQENFFRYARMNFGLDRLADYCTDEITDPIEVVNPAYRTLDSQVRSANGKLSRTLAQYGALNIETTIEAEKMEPFLSAKSALHDQVEGLKTDIAKLKAERKETPHYIKIEELPEANRFRKLSTASKHFIDTIKIVAYRAECAMTNIVREFMPKPDQARALIATLHVTEADLLPDYTNKTLTVRLHHSARVHTDTVIAKLCDELNATETVFPRTELRMIFKMGSP